jgi:hypothetical protein
MAGKTEGDVSGMFVIAARLLLSTFTLLLLLTPWTESYRLLDNFPRGQDSELNILALLAFLGLVLLLARSSRSRLRAFPLLRNWLWLLLDPAVPVDNPSLHGRYTLAPSPPAPLESSFGVFNLPLLI